MSAGRITRHPVTSLFAANLASAPFGLVQGIVVAGLLGPESLGAVGVVAALCAVAANFFDFRLVDYVTSLYYDPQHSTGAAAPEYRASVIRVGFAIQCCVAVLIALLAVVLNVIVLQALVAAPVAWSAIFAIAAAEAVLYGAAYISYCLRYSEDIAGMSLETVLRSGVRATVLIAGVYWAPTISGYALAHLVSAFMVLLIAAFLLRRSFARTTDVPLFARHLPGVWPHFRRGWKFMLATNVMGYAKLVNRGADVAIVAFFCTDRDTGFYKLARQLTDALFMSYEAAAKWYQPHIMSLLRSLDYLAVTRLARRLVAGGAAITLVVLAAIALGLPLVFDRFLPDYRGAVTLTAILAVSLFIALGVQLWVWPVLVHGGRLREVALLSLAAVAVGQILMPISLGTLSGHYDVHWFAIGNALVPFLTYVPLGFAMRGRLAMQAT